MPDADKPPPEFMSALVTEHFVLQSVSSATISESSSRVTIYLSSLSSGLVAIGFASSSHKALAALAFTVLPTVFLLGWAFLFTMASMVIVVNSVLLGATVTLVGTLAAGAPIGAAVGIGVVAGLLGLILNLRYEHHRVTPFVLGAHPARPD
jgi:hypothetical protein